MLATLSVKVEESTLKTVELYAAIAPQLPAEFPENVLELTLKFFGQFKYIAPPLPDALQPVNLQPDKYPLFTLIAQ